MRVILGFVLVILSFNTAHASETTDTAQIKKPRVAIIIDDLGDRLRDGRRVIALSGKLTIGIIPYTPFASKLAAYATEQDNELLLHLPMESIHDRYLGKSGLHSKMSEDELNTSLQQSLNSIKNIRGVSNHMGSLLTQDKKIMQWLMQALQTRGGLYFVDSMTISTSQALNAAKQAGLEHATRDVFLDNDTSTKAMDKQWRYFLKQATKKGSAILIAHPYPQTIVFLKQKLPELEQQGYELLHVSELIQWRHNRSKLAWQNQESSSP